MTGKLFIVGLGPGDPDMQTPQAGAALAFADPNTGQVSGVVIPPTVGSTRDFLLCPYPQVATFNAAVAKQKGAVDVAANWSCKVARQGTT